MNKSSPQRDPHKKEYLVNSEGFKSSYLPEIEPSKIQIKNFTAMKRG